MKKFIGTGVALVTPFKQDGAIDINGLKKLVNHVITGGVDYLVILGTTGEAATLSDAESQKVIETIIEENNGRVPNVIGCGGNNTSAVAAQINSLHRKFSPDGFLSVSPYYNKPSQDGLVEHFKYVCGATDLPIILYNVPGRTASNMLPEAVLKIAAQCSNAVAIKEASGNLEQGSELIAHKTDNFLVLSGDDTLGLPSISLGYAGVISVIANAMPGQYSEMVKNALSGQFESARKRHYQMLDLMQLNFAEGNPAGIKALLKLLGICELNTRLPILPASETLLEKMKKELAPLY